MASRPGSLFTLVAPCSFQTDNPRATLPDSCRTRPVRVPRREAAAYRAPTVPLLPP